MLQERISDELKEAMRAKDKVRLRTLRALRTALREKEIEEGGDLTEEQELQIVQKQAKQRREAIEQYEKGNREDLVAKEQEELAVLQDYLPRQLTDEEVEEVVAEIIDDTGASSMADMGNVMGRAMSQLRGRADGRRVQQIVQRELS